MEILKIIFYFNRWFFICFEDFVLLVMWNILWFCCNLVLEIIVKVCDIVDLDILGVKL